MDTELSLLLLAVPVLCYLAGWVAGASAACRRLDRAASQAGLWWLS